MMIKISSVLIIVLVTGLSICFFEVLDGYALEVERYFIGNSLNDPARWIVSGLGEIDSIDLEIVNLHGSNKIIETYNSQEDKLLIEYKFNAAGVYKIIIKADNGDNVEFLQIVGPEYSDSALSEAGFEKSLYKQCETDMVYDVIVVDGTSAGIGAAVTASREGLSVCLLEPTSLIGGMFTNGIGKADIGLNNFYQHQLSYGLFDELINKATGGGGDFSTRPSEMRNALYGLVKYENNLTIQRFSRFTGNVIRNINNVFQLDFKVFEESKNDISEKTYQSKYIIDATDSGDVLAAYGGAESFNMRNPPMLYSFVMTIRKYEDNESNWSYMKDPPVNCSVVGGIEGIYTDKSIETSWTFDAGNLGESSSEDDEVVSIYQVKHHEDLGVAKIQDIESIINNVTGNDIKIKLNDTCIKGMTGNVEENISKLGDELIDCDAYGTSVPVGYASAKGDADKKRYNIIERYLNHTLCYLYHIQHNQDTDIGLTKSEDILRGNFPARIYIREGRRVVGKEFYSKDDTLITESSFFRPNQKQSTLKHSIGFASYTRDSHSVNIGNPVGSFFDNVKITGPGVIPFGVIVPRNMPNILVPMAVSADAEGYSVLRMDPTRMNLGQVAALAISEVENYNKRQIDKQNIIEIGNLLDDEYYILFLGMQKKYIEKYNGGIYVYADVKDKSSWFWSKTAVQFLSIWDSIHDIVNTYNFNMSKNISRQEFIKAILMSYGYIAKYEQDSDWDLNENDFSDYEQFNEIYKPYVAYAKNKKIVEGYRNKYGDLTGYFGPVDPSNRAQAAKIVYGVRSLGDKGSVVMPDQCAGSQPFEDVMLNAWYCPYVNAIKDDGFVKGYANTNEYGPGNNILREEAAMIGCRMYLHNWLAKQRDNASLLVDKFGENVATELFGVEREIEGLCNEYYPFVYSIDKPEKIKVNNEVVFTVKGVNLPDELAFFVEDCDRIHEVNSSDDNKSKEIRYFNCVPLASGNKTGLVKNKPGKEGYVMLNFSVDVLN